MNKINLSPPLISEKKFFEKFCELKNVLRRAKRFDFSCLIRETKKI